MGGRRAIRRRLADGAVVGVVAPAFAVERPPLERGLAWLEAQGYVVRRGRHLLARSGYLAGSDEARLEDLRGMLLDPQVDAVWFARGGYGTARLLDGLPWRSRRLGGKLLIGYSDLTALFAPIIDRLGGRCLYGPVVTELGDSAAFDRRSLFQVLAGERRRIEIAPRQVLAHGQARGRLVGGNLSVLAHLAGTAYFPRRRGSILFLEDWGEPTYRLDRLLNQLRQAGLFDGLAGVLVGTLIVPPRQQFPPDRRVLDVLRENFAGLGIPVVRGLCSGHGRGKQTLPLGEPATIDTHAGRIELGR